ncbi:MAG: hypothetical protein EYC69_00085 [Bacteroidetes bacterium]|nr:MAG: hypothetical protein EYC69_00085 [Bacteroidota bacterium]
MEYKLFIQLIKEPARSGTESVNSLQELVNEFPYFQSAHMLLARAMKEQQHIRFEKQLKLAAAYSPDRKVLFSLLNDKKKLSESFAEKLSEEVVSPFILEESQVPEAVETLISDQEATENPFIESAINTNTVIEKNSESEESVFTHPGKEESIEPRYAMEAEEIISPVTLMPLASTKEKPAEPVSSDPREVLRRRLAEILGDPGQSDASNKLTTAGKTSESIEIKASIPAVENAEITKEREEKTDHKKDHVKESMPSETLLNTLSSIPDPPIAEPEAIDSLKELLPEDSSKPLDAIQKLELEYAMEETLLSSLENLPPIESEKSVPKAERKEGEGEVAPIVPAIASGETVQDISQTRSFNSWLKKLSYGEFGQVEEVHAYDAVEENKESHANTGQAKKENPAEKAGLAQKQASKSEDLKPTTDSLSGFESQKKELIDKFIATEPKIVPSKVEFYSPVTQAKRSIEEYDDVVSETLAKIYRMQGNNLKARFCYEKLSLFYPEKRTYFAALIKEIDEELNSSNQEDL